MVGISEGVLPDLKKRASQGPGVYVDLAWVSISRGGISEGVAFGFLAHCPTFPTLLLNAPRMLAAQSILSATAHFMELPFILQVCA